MSMTNAELVDAIAYAYDYLVNRHTSNKIYDLLHGHLSALLDEQRSRACTNVQAHGDICVSSSGHHTPMGDTITTNGRIGGCE